MRINNVVIIKCATIHFKVFFFQLACTYFNAYGLIEIILFHILFSDIKLNRKDHLF